ncbi:helix-turn-helix domain-containing protein [Paenibacillus tarimensis]
MNKTWFRRLLLSYLPVFFIVTMILFMLLFQIINEQSRRDAGRANEYVGQQVMIYMDSTLKSIEHKVLRDVITNQNVNRFFKAPGEDVYANIMAVKAMDEIRIAHQHIHSIYFVRLSDGYILNDGSVSHLSQFEDKPFIKEFIEKGQSKKWSGVRGFASFNNQPKERVFTLAKGYPFLTDHTEGIFVVNVDVASMLREINKMHNPETSYVHIIDQNKQSVLGSESLPPSGIHSSFTSEYTGWTVETGMKQGEVIQAAFTIYNIWMIIALAAVLFGVVWFLIVTKRNNRPIQQMVNLLQTYSKKSGIFNHQSLNEFSFIQTTLESMVKQSEEFQQQHVEDLIERKKYFFHEVLEGTRRIDDEEWMDKLEQYHFDVQGRTCSVHMVEIDLRHAFMKQYNIQDRSLLKFVLASAIQETANNLGAALWAEWTTEFRLTYIVWLPEDSDDEAFNQTLCKTYAEWVEQHLSFTVTIAQGGPAENLEEIRKSYEQAAENLEYKAVLGCNSIIRSEHIQGTKTEIRSLLKTIFQLLQSLRLSEDDWRKHLNLLFGQMKDARMPRREVESVLTFLTHHLDRELSELAKEYHDVWIDALDDIMQFSETWETVDELQSNCVKVFEDMSQKMEKLRESKSNRAMIQDIRTYIENNYSNPDLSLDHLSGIFQVNSKYLSKMFKDEFGENFVDFLIGLRINTAKKLLFTSQSSIQEISQAVGYTNYISFNRAFKNTVGISPRDFRKQVHGLNG